jgi:hypothetical protein
MMGVSPQMLMMMQYAQETGQMPPALQQQVNGMVTQGMQ